MEAVSIFLLAVVVGSFFEITYSYIHTKITGKKFKINHKLTLGKQVSLLSIPIWGLLALLAFKHYSYVHVFLIASVIGPILEVMLGTALYKLFGVSIWTYQHVPLGKYTSIYAIPYWGAAAVVFASLAKFSGL